MRYVFLILLLAICGCVTCPQIECKKQECWCDDGTDRADIHITADCKYGCSGDAIHLDLPKGK